MIIAISLYFLSYICLILYGTSYHNIINIYDTTYLVSHEKFKLSALIHQINRITVEKKTKNRWMSDNSSIGFSVDRNTETEADFISCNDKQAVRYEPGWQQPAVPAFGQCL